MKRGVYLVVILIFFVACKKDPDAGLISLTDLDKNYHCNVNLTYQGVWSQNDSYDLVLKTKHLGDSIIVGPWSFYAADQSKVEYSGNFDWPDYTEEVTVKFSAALDRIRIEVARDYKTMVYRPQIIYQGVPTSLTETTDPATTHSGLNGTYNLDYHFRENFPTIPDETTTNSSGSYTVNFTADGLSIDTYMFDVDNFHSFYYSDNCNIGGINTVRNVDLRNDALLVETIYTQSSSCGDSTAGLNALQIYRYQGVKQ